MSDHYSAPASRRSAGAVGSAIAKRHHSRRLHWPGNRGSFVLSHALKVPGAKIVALCDLDEVRLGKAKAAAESAGHTPVTYTDFRKMLDERKDIDAVIIETPVDTHKMVSLAALEVGKHVYCEKPMAITPEDARAMVAAAASAKGIFQAGFKLRHDPNRAASIDFLHKGGMGKMLYGHGTRHTGDLPRETPW